MTSSIVIATNNRAEPLKECLDSLNRQTRLPDEVVIAHGGSDAETNDFIEAAARGLRYRYPIFYYNFGPLGAASQRNEGVKKSKGEIIFFLDDDVVCEPDFIEHTLNEFNKDEFGKVGGVSGTIVNQTYTPLKSVNRFMINGSIEKSYRRPQYPGRLLGPALNFLPQPHREGLAQRVDWMPSCCCAYRREVFNQFEFNKKFSGYSFMEDVDLSARVAKKYILLNSSKAKLFHKDLGGKTHIDWSKIGQMQVLNRWHVMINVMGKRKFSDRARFFYYQLIYCTLSEARGLFSRADVKNTLGRWWGRVRGVARLHTVPYEDVYGR